MLIHQPNSFDSGDEVTYFSPDLVSEGPISVEGSKRLGLKKFVAGESGLLSGGINSGGAQPLIQQFAVRPFN